MHVKAKKNCRTIPEYLELIIFIFSLNIQLEVNFCFMLRSFLIIISSMIVYSIFSPFMWLVVHKIFNRIFSIRNLVEIVGKPPINTNVSRICVLLGLKKVEMADGRLCPMVKCTRPLSVMLSLPSLNEMNIHEFAC